MPGEEILPLDALEPRLRNLLPADLYASAWLDQSPQNLERVFEHLRTLLRILHDYMPPQLTASPTPPGRVRQSWEQGALIFTDLSGFTPLMEANFNRGPDGARTLLGVLNSYFSNVIEIVSKSSGELLEFTGDALLIQFPAGRRGDHVAQAVRAGLRMQRAMARFEHIETEIGEFTLGMRVGIHVGRFLTADIGTPIRMEHVLLGQDVHDAKLAEGAGSVGRVCLSQAAYDQVTDLFRFEPATTPGYMLVVDDLSDDELGTFDISLTRRRMAGGVLMDRSVEGLMNAIEDMVAKVEPLAAFIPDPVLHLLNESAAERHITPDFPRPIVMFVNVLGLAEALSQASPEEAGAIVTTFSRTFARINAAVEARGGLLKKVTYHLAGSDIMIMFGVPVSHTDEPVRAAKAALAIRDIILSAEKVAIGGNEVEIGCQIGLSYGLVFSGEIGEMRGRREFNILGDMVNTAARLMGKAVGNRILVTEALFEVLKEDFACDSIGSMPLKGKSERLRLYSLRERSG
jgi:class 3 adenylate cyclase